MHAMNCNIINYYHTKVESIGIFFLINWIVRLKFVKGNLRNDIGVLNMWYQKNRFQTYYIFFISETM